MALSSMSKCTAYEILIWERSETLLQYVVTIGDEVGFETLPQYVVTTGDKVF